MKILTPWLTLAAIVDRRSGFRQVSIVTECAPPHVSLYPSIWGGFWVEVHLGFIFHMKTMYYKSIMISDTFLMVFDTPKSCQKVIHMKLQLFR